MSYSISDIENHLAGMVHGNSLNKITNKYYVHERAANAVKSKVDLVTAIRRASLVQAVHSDVYNYTLPSDFSKIIDIYPQANRQSTDFGYRKSADTFDLLKNSATKQLSIESNNGTRFIRLDWDVKTPKTLDTLNDITKYSAIGTAANLAADTLNYITPSKSLRFDVVTTGDGVQSTTLGSLDLTDEDEVATFFAWLYIPDASLVTSVQAKWGNDLSTAYWTSTAVTAQHDSTAFQNGWNLLGFNWSSATETGTVDPSAIDSFSIAITGSAQTQFRLDNIQVSLGEIFEIKYYSAYYFQSSAGTYKIRPTTDTDVVLLDDLALNIYLHEWLKAAAQQMEGEDSAFDIQYSNAQLNGDGSSPDPYQRKGLYRLYKKEYPSQAKKTTSSWMTGRNIFKRSW